MTQYLVIEELINRKYLDSMGKIQKQNKKKKETLCQVLKGYKQVAWLLQS